MTTASSPSSAPNSSSRGVDRVGRGLALDQDVRRAADRPALVAVEDVAVAAHAGVARPFVAGQADERARLVELGGEPVELLPERVGDLEVVALVADDVDEGRVARVAEVVFGRTHADGLAALAVQIAPVAPQRRGRHDAQRIGARELLAVSAMTRSSTSPGASATRFSITRGPSPRLDRDARGQAAHRPRRRRARASASRLVGRIAPHVLGDDRQPERLAHDRERRQDRLPARRRPGHQVERRLLRQLAELVGRERVDGGLELDSAPRQLVCSRKPGEPCRRSPKRTVSVSPARR